MRFPGVNARVCVRFAPDWAPSRMPGRGYLPPSLHIGRRGRREGAQHVTPDYRY